MAITAARRQQRYDRERSFEGYLVVKYRMMKQRVAGKGTSRPDLYLGTPIMPKEEFMEWARNHPVYERLYFEWVKAGFPNNLAPCPDRQQPVKGYTVSNIIWKTVADNARAAVAKRKKP